MIIVSDGGWKYLSTGVWTDDIDAVEARAKPPSTSERSAEHRTGRGH